MCHRIVLTSLVVAAVVEAEPGREAAGALEKNRRTLVCGHWVNLSDMSSFSHFLAGGGGGGAGVRGGGGGGVYPFLLKSGGGGGGVFGLFNAIPPLLGLHVHC